VLVHAQAVSFFHSRSLIIGWDTTNAADCIPRISPSSAVPLQHAIMRVARSTSCRLECFCIAFNDCLVGHHIGLYAVTFTDMMTRSQYTLCRYARRRSSLRIDHRYLPPMFTVIEATKAR